MKLGKYVYAVMILEGMGNVDGADFIRTMTSEEREVVFDDCNTVNDIIERVEDVQEMYEIDRELSELTRNWID